MASSVFSSLPAVERADTPVWHAGIPILAFALMPLWALVVVTFALPTFFPPMSLAQPNDLGIDLATAVEGIAMGWMLIGLGIIWRTRNEVIGSIALPIFTVPATVAVVLAPAAALVIQNVG